MLRRPLIGIALCYGPGTWLGLTFRAPPTDLLAGALALWALALVCMRSARKVEHASAAAMSSSARRHRIAATVFVAGAMVLTAWLAARVHPLNNTATGPAGVADLVGRRVEAEGVVADDPDVIVTSTNGARMARFTLRVERLRVDAGPWEERGARVRVVWRGASKGWIPRYGERWRMTGAIATWAAGEEDGQTDELGRRCHLRAFGAGARFLSGGHGWSVIQSCYAARRGASRLLAVGIEDHPETVGLLNALLLGYRTQMPRATKQAFALSGTLHIFAISGSHVVVMAGLIIFALNSLGISRLRWILALAPLLTAYTLATGMQPSAARACLMAIVYWAACGLNRRADTLSALALSALVILAASPAQLLDMGFILSFAVVLGLIVLYPVFARPVRRLLAQDPLRVQPETRWNRAVRSVGQSLGDLTAMSAAAWMASAPLTAYCFEMFSPVSVPANLAIVPLAFLSVLAGCLSLVLGACVPFLADVFNHANVAVLGVMVWITDKAAGLPMGAFMIPRPPLWWLAVWYGALGAGWLWVRARRGGEGVGLDEDRVL